MNLFLRMDSTPKPVYDPGPLDIQNGNVILTVSATGIGECAATTIRPNFSDYCWQPVIDAELLVVCVKALIPYNSICYKLRYFTLGITRWRNIFRPNHPQSNIRTQSCRIIQWYSNFKINCHPTYPLWYYRSRRSHLQCISCTPSQCRRRF